MRQQQIEELVGITASISNAHTPTSYEDFYTFEGDLCQMVKATKVAESLGIKVGYIGVVPYVVAKKDFDRVVRYIVEHKIEGYWHYEEA